MAQFKCKMCGGTLEINNNETVAVCEYCGTQQTLPKLDDEKRVNLYDRANHFRRNNEFDKAMGVYEQILNEDGTDAEAYWSLVLCRYGIEYVEDPSSHKRIPTVNRAQFTSIFDDDNYKSALQYADTYQQHVYAEEARAINEIQKGILAISQKEEPFDIFICYKESDDSGNRTPDSVLAQDLYYQLTQDGFKVFFSRITLEDKLGSAYEPYIFAALNSAKVMVALGTKPEHFNAVWVRNEWSRYLGLIKNGANKMLIPAYRDMDPYNLPEEFSHLQAQDMSKLGFMQDLIRGIKKIAQADIPKTTVVKETVVSGGNSNIAPLLKRAFIFLEDGDWASAEEYCEKVLDLDPECAQAYLGKLMSEYGIKKQEELKDVAQPFDGNNNFQKAIRFGDEALRNTLDGYIDFINTRNENNRLEQLYSRAKTAMDTAVASELHEAEECYKKAAELFSAISAYKDAAQLIKQCQEKADEAKEKTEAARKNKILAVASEKIKKNVISVTDCREALAALESVSGWKDADQKAEFCRTKIAELQVQEEIEQRERERQEEEKRLDRERKEALAAAKAKRNKKAAIFAMSIVCAIIVFVVILNTAIIPNTKYKDAIVLLDTGNVIEAYEALMALDGYKDSTEKANSIFDNYKMEKLRNAKAGEYVLFGSYEQDNDITNGRENIEWLILEVTGEKTLVISKYGLDCRQYNAGYTDVTWENWYLRKWLNSTFINLAFSADEMAMIPTVTVSADKNPKYSMNPGEATQDQVFLLSITEANRYFPSDSARQCKATRYAVAQGVSVNNSNGNCWWWLRSPGEEQSKAAEVYSDGNIGESGSTISPNSHAIRPAMWIDLHV